MTYTNNTEHLSEETMKFLADWYQWTLAGAPDVIPFYRDDGLCRSFMEYTGSLTSPQLKQQFTMDGLDFNYPFGYSDYCFRFYNDTMHLCPKRLAWVAAKLGLV